MKCWVRDDVLKAVAGRSESQMTGTYKYFNDNKPIKS